MNPPVRPLDPAAFHKDPYPFLRSLRSEAPICFVPELDAVMVTRRDDVFALEKKVDVFSSVQPGGLMTVLMGENLMRKDGDEHSAERLQMNESLSPSMVKNQWQQLFYRDTQVLLDTLEGKTEIDLVTEFAMPVSANALRRVTGLNNLSPEQLDWASQSMIDGIANYAGNPAIEERCHEATGLIDQCIDDRLPEVSETPEASLISVLTRAGQPLENVRANIKLAISGGQNEPRDAIAGTTWALLNHPQQLQAIRDGINTWRDAFEEYARWMSPIGMSPRRIAKPYQWHGVDFLPEQRVFLMFGSANRDEAVFDKPDCFDISRDTRKAVSFGAGPHFCAGAWVSRCLIGEVALPLLFERFPDMRLSGKTEFAGWAFRGPLQVQVELQPG